jgi:hypothetical protein
VAVEPLAVCGTGREREAGRMQVPLRKGARRVDDKKEPQGSRSRIRFRKRVRGRLKWETAEGGGKREERKWWHGVTAKYIRCLMIDGGERY